MTLISLAAAKGAPGTTTLALLTAALWPRTSVLVDADVRGGDIAYRMPLVAGGPVNPDRGLMSLMPLARKQLAPETIAEHSQTLLGGTELIAGLSEPEQAAAVQQLWPSLGSAFAEVTTHDVIADLGSLWASASHFPLVRKSTALIFVMRPRPADVIHTRRRLVRMRTALPAATPVFGVVVVAEERDSRDAQAAFASLGEEVLRYTEYLGHLAFDPKGVGMFEGTVINRPERTELVRSGLPIVEKIAQLAGIRIDRQEMIAAGAIPAQKPRRRKATKRSAKEGTSAALSEIMDSSAAGPEAGVPAIPQQPPAPPAAPPTAPGTPSAAPGTPPSAPGSPPAPPFAPQPSRREMRGRQ